jgi:hypothetical protein
MANIKIVEQNLNLLLNSKSYFSDLTADELSKIKGGGYTSPGTGRAISYDPINEVSTSLSSAYGR